MSAEMVGCFSGDYKISSIYARAMDAALPSKMETIRNEINLPPYDSVSLAKSVVYDVYQLVDQPVRECNQTNVAIWAEQQSKIFDNAELAKADAKHSRTSWDEQALEASLRTIRAFKDLGIPLIVAAGTLLGWYRQCGIITHTTDVDFYVPFDYIITMERFWAIRVCCFTFLPNLL
jgi:hypothetical protein